MDLGVILDILYAILMIAALILSYVFERKGYLYQHAENAIASAEEVYRDCTEAGGIKFQYAVNFVYSKIPKQIRLFFPKEMIENIIQSAFDRMEEYAKIQLDKVADKIENDIKERVDC